MTLRDFFNGILAVIGTTSLTDVEYDLMSGTAGYTQANYDQLTAMLIARSAVSPYVDRATAYWTARGVEVTPAKTGSSNILVGAVL